MLTTNTFRIVSPLEIRGRVAFDEMATTSTTGRVSWSRRSSWFSDRIWLEWRILNARRGYSGTTRYTSIMTLGVIINDVYWKRTGSIVDRAEYLPSEKGKLFDITRILCATRIISRYSDRIEFLRIIEFPGAPSTRCSIRL